MDALFGILEGIGRFALSIGSFVISFFQDVVYLIFTTGRLLVELPGYIFWMPSYFRTYLLFIFGIVVLYKIMGREG